MCRYLSLPPCSPLSDVLINICKSITLGNTINSSIESYALRVELGLWIVHWSCTALPYSFIVEDNSGRPSGVCPSYCHELISVAFECPQEPFPSFCASSGLWCMGDKSTTGSSGGAIHFIMVRVSKQVMLDKKDAALDNVEGGMRVFTWFSNSGRGWVVVSHLRQGHTLKWFRVDGGSRTKELCSSVWIPLRWMHRSAMDDYVAVVLRCKEDLIVEWNVTLLFPSLGTLQVGFSSTMLWGLIEGGKVGSSCQYLGVLMHRCSILLALWDDTLLTSQ